MTHDPITKQFPDIHWHFSLVKDNGLYDNLTDTQKNDKSLLKIARDFKSSTTDTIYKVYAVIPYNHPILSHDIHAYEILDDGMLVRYVFDIEFNINYAPSKPLPFIDQVRIFLQESIQLVNQTFKDTLTHPIDPNHTVILESCCFKHDYYKVSYHLHLPFLIDWSHRSFFLFRDHDQTLHGLFAPTVHAFNDQTPDKKAIDISIYTKNRNMRAVLQSKYDDEHRTLNIVSPQHKPIHHYYIGIYSDDIQLPIITPNMAEFVRKHVKKTYAKHNKPSSSSYVTQLDFYNNHLLYCFLMCINNEITIIHCGMWKSILYYTFRFLIDVSKEKWDDMQGSLPIPYVQRIQTFQHLFFIWTNNGYQQYSIYNQLNYKQLRVACKTHGIQYTRLDIRQMRHALENKSPTNITHDASSHLTHIQKQLDIALKDSSNHIETPFNPFNYIQYMAQTACKNVFKKWKDVNILPSIRCNINLLPARFIIKSYPDFGQTIDWNHKYNVLSAECGYGKSQLLQDHIINHPSMSVLIIVANINLSISLHKRFNHLLRHNGFTLYNNVKAPYDYDKFIVSMQSLDKVVRTQYDVIFIDEAEETIGSIANDTTKKKRPSIIHKFNILMQSTNNVVFADAAFKISGEILRFIHRVAEIEDKTIHLYHSDHTRLKQRYIVRAKISRYSKKIKNQDGSNPYSIERMFLEDIVKDVKLGLRVCGFFSFQKHSHIFIQRFKTEGIQAVVVTGDTKTDKHIERYIKNPKLIVKDNIQVFLHTSTVKTGFSFEEVNYFHHKVMLLEEFGCIRDAINTTITIIQASQRFRYTHLDPLGYQLNFLYFKSNPDIEHYYSPFLSDVLSDYNHINRDYNNHIHHNYQEAVKNLIIDTTLKNNRCRETIHVFAYVIRTIYINNLYEEPPTMIINHQGIKEYLIQQSYPLYDIVPEQNIDITPIMFKYLAPIHDPYSLGLFSHPVLSEHHRSMLQTHYHGTYREFNKIYTDTLNTLKSNQNKLRHMVFIFSKFYTNADYSFNKFDSDSFTAGYTELVRKNVDNEIIEHIHLATFEKLFHRLYLHKYNIITSLIILLYDNQFNIAKVIINDDNEYSKLCGHIHRFVQIVSIDFKKFDPNIVLSGKSIVENKSIIEEFYQDFIAFTKLFQASLDDDDIAAKKICKHKYSANLSSKVKFLALKLFNLKLISIGKQKTLRNKDGTRTDYFDFKIDVSDDITKLITEFRWIL